MSFKKSRIIKEPILFVFLILIIFLPYKSIFSTSEPIRLYPGNLSIRSTISNDKQSFLYKVWVFSENPMIISIKDPNVQVEIIAKNEKEELVNISKETENRFVILTNNDSYIHFSVNSTYKNLKINLSYKYPYKAIVSFAKTYQEFSIPWQKRIYIENYISPIEGNERKYSEENYYISYLVDFGAPYSWGGKEFPDEIVNKLKINGTVNNWRDYYNTKVKYPTNLDASESCYDYERGPENPQKWVGVDCSGLVEKCATLSGLIYDYHNSLIISKGDFRGAENFRDVREGDILVLLRDGVIVHFGLISKKGPTIETTYMIHSAWFTSLRYNTNGPLKVIETSIGEFRSLYNWNIIRFKTKE